MARRTNRTIMYSEHLRWMPLGVKGSQGNAWIKTLSKDDETGARTALIKYEPGFQAEAGTAVWPIDMYVLDGEMTAGDRRYEKDTFHYRPAGTAIGPIHTRTGITRIVFSADTKDPARSSPDEVFVHNVRADLPWDPPSHEVGGGHIQHRMDEPEARDRQYKTLRRDPLANIRIWILSARRAGGRNAIDEMHAHPAIEETFQIEGEDSEYMDEVEGRTTWVPGTYVCRPADECLHGDSMKLTDNHYLLVRCFWTDDPAKAAAWKEHQDRTTRRVPNEVVFDE